MLPASAINAMRRDVIAELTAKRGRAAPARLNAYDEPPRYDGIAGEPQLTIAVRTAGQITSRMLSMKPTVLYVPLSELAEHPDLPQRVSVETQRRPFCPRVVWSGSLLPSRGQLRTDYEMGVRQVLARKSRTAAHCPARRASPSAAISASISSIPAPCGTCASRGLIRSFCRLS